MFRPSGVLQLGVMYMIRSICTELDSTVGCIIIIQFLILKVICLHKTSNTVNFDYGTYKSIASTSVVEVVRQQI